MHSIRLWKSFNLTRYFGCIGGYSFPTSDLLTENKAREVRSRLYVGLSILFDDIQNGGVRLENSSLLYEQYSDRSSNYVETKRGAQHNGWPWIVEIRSFCGGIKSFLSY